MQTNATPLELYKFTIYLDIIINKSSELYNLHKILISLNTLKNYELISKVNAMDKKDLPKLRKEIEKLDIELFSLIFERVGLAKKIGKVKFENNIEITNLNREKALINLINNLSSNCLERDQIESVYKILFKISKEKQKDII